MVVALWPSPQTGGRGPLADRPAGPTYHVCRRHGIPVAIECRLAMERRIVSLFALLTDFGLEVNPLKSSLMIKVAGDSARKLDNGRPHWRLAGSAGDIVIPLVTYQQYLGTILSFGRHSDRECVSFPWRGSVARCGNYTNLYGAHRKSVTCAPVARWCISALCTGDLLSC